MNKTTITNIRQIVPPPPRPLLAKFILLLTTILILALASCDSGGGGGGAAPTPTPPDPALNGTWAWDSDETFVYVFNNGAFEYKEVGDVLTQKGTYTAKDGAVTLTKTHYNAGLGLETKAQFLEEYKGNATVIAQIEKIFTPYSGTYTATKLTLKEYQVGTTNTYNTNTYTKQ